MNMKKLSILFAALVAGVAMHSFGEIDPSQLTRIDTVQSGAQAFSDHAYNSDRMVSHIIDLSGMTQLDDGSFVCGTGSANGTAWHGKADKFAGCVLWIDLGKEYSLGALKFFNLNWSGQTGRGLKEIEVYVSTLDAETINASCGTWHSGDRTYDTAPDLSDATIWTKLDAYTLTAAPGKATYAGEPLEVLDKVVAARTVAIKGMSAYGSGYGGLSEVFFYEFTGEVTAPSLGVCSVARENGAFKVSAEVKDNTAQSVKAYAYASEDDANPVAQVIGTNVAAGETATGVLTGLAADTMYKIVVKADSGEAGADEKEIKTAIYTGEISIVKVQDGKEFGNPAIAEVSRGAATSYGLTVAYAVSGTAVSGVNYEPLSGTVTIPAGSAAAQIVVTPMFDPSAGATSVTLTLGDGLYSISESANTVTLTIESGEVPDAIVFDGEVLVYEGFSANDYTFAASGSQGALDAARIRVNGNIVQKDDVGLLAKSWSGNRHKIYDEGRGLELPALMQEAGMSALGTAVGMDTTAGSQSAIRSAHMWLDETALAPSAAPQGKFYFRLLMSVDSKAAAVMEKVDVLGDRGNNYGAGFIRNPNTSSGFYAWLFKCTSGVAFFIQKKKDDSLKAVLGVTDKDGALTSYEMGDVAADKTYIFYAEVTPLPGADMIRAGYQDVANYNPSVSKLWKVKDIFQNVYDGDSYPNEICYGGCHGTNGGYFRVDEFRVGTGIDTILKVSKGGMMILVR